MHVCNLQVKQGKENRVMPGVCRMGVAILHGRDFSDKVPSGQTPERSERPGPVFMCRKGVSRQKEGRRVWGGWSPRSQWGHGNRHGQREETPGRGVRNRVTVRSVLAGEA